MPIIKRLRFFAEYLLLRLLAGFFCILPWDTAVKLGARLGRFGIKISRKRFALATGNIRKAMPELSQEEAENIALKSWENMGVIAAEVVQASRMTKEQLLEKCVLDNPEVLLDLLKQKKPALVHMCHMGNWEIAAMAVAAIGMPVCGVARHIRNPYVDELLAKIRMQFGGEVIFHREPFFSCVRHLKRGKLLGILWKPPFRVDITAAVRPGKNTLRVKVTNLWPNRLIGDQKLPEKDRFTWTTFNPYKADSPLLDSGLLGPVTVRN